MPKLITSLTIRYHGGSESSIGHDGGLNDNMVRIYRAAQLPGVSEVTYLLYVDGKPQYPSTTLTAADLSETLVAVLDKVDAAKRGALFGGDKQKCSAYIWGMIAMMEEVYSHKEWWLQNYAIQCADEVARQCNTR